MTETREDLLAQVESNRKASEESDDDFDRRLYYEQMLRAQHKLRSFDVV